MRTALLGAEVLVGLLHMVMSVSLARELYQSRQRPQYHPADKRPSLSLVVVSAVPGLVSGGVITLDLLGIDWEPGRFASIVHQGVLATVIAVWNAHRYGVRRTFLMNAIQLVLPSTVLLLSWALSEAPAHADAGSAPPPTVPSWPVLSTTLITSGAIIFVVSLVFVAMRPGYASDRAKTTAGFALAVIALGIVTIFVPAL